MKRLLGLLFMFVFATIGFGQQNFIGEVIDFGDITPDTPMYTAEVIDQLIATPPAPTPEEDFIMYKNSSFDEWPHTLNILTYRNQFYEMDLDAADTNKIYELNLPTSIRMKDIKVNIYIHQSPINKFYYTIGSSNITSESYPSTYQPWLSDTNEAIWKFEFESMPGTTDFTLMRYIKKDL